MLFDFRRAFARPDRNRNTICLGPPLPSEIEIRDALADDIEIIAHLGARFFDEAQWSDVTEWDHDSVCRTLSNLIESAGGILIVATRKGVVLGMVGGLVHPAYFNAHHLTGQELFWWVEPAERSGVGGLLMTAMETAAIARGAKSWAMIALDKIRPEAVSAMYRRRGYRPSERSFIKRLAA